MFLLLSLLLADFTEGMVVPIDPPAGDEEAEAAAEEARHLEEAEEARRLEEEVAARQRLQAEVEEETRRLEEEEARRHLEAEEQAERLAQAAAHDQEQEQAATQLPAVGTTGASFDSSTVYLSFDSEAQASGTELIEFQDGTQQAAATDSSFLLLGLEPWNWMASEDDDDIEESNKRPSPMDLKPRKRNKKE